MFHVSKTFWKQLPVSSLLHNAEAIGGTSPWHGLMFAIQHEICCRKFRLRSENTKKVLESFQKTHQWSFVDFYVYLFVALLKTEQLLNNNTSKKFQSSKKQDADLSKTKWFLFIKLPIMIGEWEHDNNYQNNLFYRPKSTLNSVELALVHIFRFPVLYSRVNDGLV